LPLRECFKLSYVQIAGTGDVIIWERADSYEIAKLFPYTMFD
jgi:hypothetical protein